MSSLARRSLALNLVESGQMSVAQAAKLACLPLEEFFELLGRRGVAVVVYPPEELEAELAAALPEPEPAPAPGR
jgi:predicted HTH domain antitoxin